MSLGRLMTALAAVALLAAPIVARAAEASDLPAATAQALVRAPDVPLAGAPRGDVIIVEYLDFNCPYCRLMQPELKALMRSDPKVSVLYKDWPIFGEPSRYAAMAALAARWQGKYLAAHDALIGSPTRLSSPAQVRDVLRAAGVDIGRLEQDLKAHGAQIETILSRNESEAASLGLEGTPALVVGPRLVSGAASVATLKRLVAEARRAGPAKASTSALR